MFARCGFNRNTSRNVLFGPSKYNGAGFRPFSTEQGVGQLQFFVKHWSHRTEPGCLLRIAVAWAQLNVGVGFSIFNDVVTSLPHFESEWLRSVRDFLRIVQGRLRLDSAFVPEIQRVNDSFIMDHVLERGDFTRKELRKINYCQLYLQAITVSDISNATGTTLMPGIRSGDYTLWSGVTHYHKTNQAKPDTSTWRLWSRAMSLIADPNENLYIPLRQWIPPPHRQRFIRPFYYDPLTDGLYFTRTDCFDYHRRISRRLFLIIPPISAALSRRLLTRLLFTTIRVAGSSTATIHIVQQPHSRFQRRLRLSAR
jgi:hypothetical protein